MQKWDLFICHAYEDKEEIAKPLADALEKEGLSVWYDDFTLKLGDSLRRSIEEGLAHSKYGIVILSPNFFSKEWPQKELDALIARERNGVKIVLPVWHNVDHEFILNYSPLLADRFAVETKKGLETIVGKIVNMVKPSIKHSPYILVGIINVFNRQLLLDGQIMSEEAFGYIKDGKTYLQVRHISLAAGVKKQDIYWDERNKEMTIKKGSRTLIIRSRSSIMKVNNIKVTMDREPIIVDNQLMSGVNYVANALGADVIFDEETKSIVFTSYRE